MRFMTCVAPQNVSSSGHDRNSQRRRSRNLCRSAHVCGKVRNGAWPRVPQSLFRAYPGTIAGSTTFPVGCDVSQVFVSQVIGSMLQGLGRFKVHRHLQERLCIPRLLPLDSPRHIVKPTLTSLRRVSTSDITNLPSRSSSCRCSQECLRRLARVIWHYSSLQVRHAQDITCENRVDCLLSRYLVHV